NASALGGTLTSVVEDRYANLHLFKLFRSGTQVTLDSLNDRLDSNSRFNQLRPQYKPQLAFSLVQPLLQSFGWDFSYLVVRVAERTADAAVYQYEANLANFVEQVIEAYWAVVGARETVEVDREAKQLADRTVEENQARVRVGLLPPVSVLEAQADAASRQSDLIAHADRRCELPLARAEPRVPLQHPRPSATVAVRRLGIRGVRPDAHQRLQRLLLRAPAPGPALERARREPVHPDPHRAFGGGAEPSPAALQRDPRGAPGGRRLGLEPPAD